MRELGDKYYLYFWAIVKNNTNGDYNAHSFLYSNDTLKIKYVGSLKIPQSYQYAYNFDTEAGTSLYWHEVQQSKNYLIKLNSKL